jgi:hypothetical protein
MCVWLPRCSCARIERTFPLVVDKYGVGVLCDLGLLAEKVQSVLKLLDFLAEVSVRGRGA